MMRMCFLRLIEFWVNYISFLIWNKKQIFLSVLMSKQDFFSVNRSCIKDYHKGVIFLLESDYFQPLGSHCRDERTSSWEKKGETYEFIVSQFIVLLWKYDFRLPDGCMLVGPEAPKMNFWRSSENVLLTFFYFGFEQVSGFFAISNFASLFSFTIFEIYF